MRSKPLDSEYLNQSLVYPAIVWMLVALGASSAGAASEPGQAGVAAAIDSVVGAALRQGPLAGMAVAAVRGQDTLVLQGYGQVQVGENLEVRPSTPFRVASVTKQFTAAAILQLAERGKLSLDDGVEEYVPSLPIGGRRVTIRHLLNHTSGIIRYGANDIIYRKGFRYTEASVVRFLGERVFAFEPGTNWHYSNLGYVLLGLIIEKVSGLPYEEYVQRNLFEPAGMNSSYIISGDARAPVGHSITESGLRLFADRGNAAWAAGGAVSTVEDLLRWQAALNKHSILSEQSIKLMYTNAELLDGSAVPYGFGTRFGELVDHRVVGHTGWWAGFTSMLAYYPDDNLTVAVLSNTASMSPHAVNVTTRIAEAVLGSRLGQAASRRRESEDRTTWSGVYRRGPTSVRVWTKEKNFYLQEAGYKNPVRLQTLGGDRFHYGKWTVQFLQATGGTRRLLRFNDGVFWDMATAVDSDR